MTNQTDLTAARDKLRALELEKAECEAIIVCAEESKKRIRELCGDYWTTGEIEQAKRAVRDLAAGPVLRDSRYERERIVAVTDKWITTRIDGHPDNDVNYYRKTDGMARGSKPDNQYANRIDAELALKLWEEWQNERDDV